MIIHQVKEESGYRYFKNQVSYIKSVDSPDKVLVYGYGVNDLHNIYISKDLKIDEYVNYINSLGLQAKVYFLTVNPIDEVEAANGPYPVYDEHIQKFNNYIKENAVNYEVIDTYAYLKQDGYKTIDGIHYDDKTSIKIYNYVKEYISNDIN